MNHIVVVHICIRGNKECYNPIYCHVKDVEDFLCPDRCREHREIVVTTQQNTTVTDEELSNHNITDTQVSSITRDGNRIGIDCG